MIMRDLGTDFLITNKNQQPVLAIEVKKNVAVTVDWATKLRRNILAHGFYFTTQFFMLVTPDKIFLWKNKPNNFDLITPDYVIEAQPFIGKYIASTDFSIDELNYREFEMIVSSWIGDLLSINDLNEFPTWMIESGLAEAIKEGSYEMEFV